MNEVFARILHDNRAAFNAQFAQARQSAPSLDGDEFAAHLRDVVAPLVQRCDEIKPERTSEVAQTLYEISLQLMSKGWLGAQSRNALVPRLWTQLLPACANVVVLAPRLMVGSACNAVVQLSQTGGANGELWLQIMADVAPLCGEATTFLQAGRVAAWRCGLASSRDAAIEAGRELSPEIVRAIFDLEETTESQIAELWTALQNDVWLAPEELATTDDATSSTRSLQLVARVGDFSGFGGAFSVPPRVALVDGALCVFEHDRSWRLFADAFGATLVRSGQSAPSVQKVAVEPWRRVVSVFPEAQNLTSLAFDGRTIALTLPSSHRVWLFA